MFFSKNQLSIIDGLMLGDGSLEKHGTNARLCITRSVKDLDYLQYQYDIFKNFCKKGIVVKPRFDKRTGKTYERAYFRTITSPIFLSIYNRWYNNKIKIIPNDLILNPLSIYTWILDDGHFEKRNSRALKIHISTHSFLKQDVYRLKSMLDDKYNCSFTISKTKNKEQYCILGANTATRYLLREIDSFIPNNIMSRKTYIWRRVGIDLYNDNFLKL